MPNPIARSVKARITMTVAPSASPPAPNCGHDLAGALGAGVARLDERHGRALLGRRLDLGVPRHGHAGLAGDRERIEQRALEQPLDD